MTVLLPQRSPVSFCSRWPASSLQSLIWALSQRRWSSLRSCCPMSLLSGACLRFQSGNLSSYFIVFSYALTLRIMLANLRRKVGLGSGINTPVPTMPPPAFADMIVSPAYIDPAMPPPFTMEELGFVWPSDRGIVSPSAIPVWLQEQVRSGGILLWTEADCQCFFSHFVEPGRSRSPSQRL